jgi:hypothetical protein
LQLVLQAAFQLCDGVRRFLRQIQAAQPYLVCWSCYKFPGTSRVNRPRVRRSRIWQ